MADSEVVNIDVLDKRLTADGIEWYCEWTKGGDPQRRILVDENTPLDTFLQTVRSRIGDARIGVLSILAHGWGEYEYRNKEDMKNKKSLKIHGGFGMEFCKESIRMDTVERFKELKGLFRGADIGIKLMGCAAAAEYQFRVCPGVNEFKKGFGKKLCGKLAEVTGVSVMASDNLQAVSIDRNERTYRWGSDIRTIKS